MTIPLASTTRQPTGQGQTRNLTTKNDRNEQLSSIPQTTQTTKVTKPRDDTVDRNLGAGALTRMRPLNTRDDSNSHLSDPMHLSVCLLGRTEAQADRSSSRHLESSLTQLPDPSHRATGISTKQPRSPGQPVSQKRETGTPIPKAPHLR